MVNVKHYFVVFFDFFIYNKKMTYHHTKNKGDLGVLKIKTDLVEKGYMVLSPETEHSPFDLVAYDSGKFIRIQAKYRTMDKNGCVSFPSRTCWSDKNGTHTKEYDKSEIDVAAIYCPDTNECYYVLMTDINKFFSIRIIPPKRNQINGVKMSVNYVNLP